MPRVRYEGWLDEYAIVSNAQDRADNVGSSPQSANLELNRDEKLLLIPDDSVIHNGTFYLLLQAFLL